MRVRACNPHSPEAEKKSRNFPKFENRAACYRPPPPFLFPPFLFFSYFFSNSYLPICCVSIIPFTPYHIINITTNNKTKKNKSTTPTSSRNERLLARGNLETSYRFSTTGTAESPSRAQSLGTSNTSCWSRTLPPGRVGSYLGYLLPVLIRLSNSCCFIKLWYFCECRGKILFFL